MEWSGYKECCPIKAVDEERHFCECGTPLLRCRGWSECSALLDLSEHCPVHVAPRLTVDESEVPKLEVGDSVALPFVFANESPCGTLGVRHVRRQLKDGGWEDVRVPFERLRPNEQRKLTVDSGTLATGGRTSISVVVEVESGLGGFHEHYAFQTTVYLDVKQRDTRSITKNININESHFEAGASGVVSTGDTIEAESGYGSRSNPLRVDPLQRFERYEMEEGLRGYSGRQVRLPRYVEVQWPDFPDGHHPLNPRPFLASSQLRCGRNGLNHTPANDVCVRYFDHGSGALNVPLSKQISGKHFEFFIQNDRIYLRDTSSNGSAVNNERLRRDEEAPLADGDRITLLDGIAQQQGQKPLQYQVAIHARGRVANLVQIRRV